MSSGTSSWSLNTIAIDRFWTRTAPPPSARVFAAPTVELVATPMIPPAGAARPRALKPMRNSGTGSRLSVKRGVCHRFPAVARIRCRCGRIASTRYPFRACTSMDHLEHCHCHRDGPVPLLSGIGRPARCAIPTPTRRRAIAMTSDTTNGAPPHIGALVRTRRGSVVHRADCTSVTRALPASRPVPWLWAVGRSREEVVETIRFFDYSVCRNCKPFTLEEIS